MCQKQIKLKITIFPLLVKSKLSKNLLHSLRATVSWTMGQHYIKSASKSFISFIISRGKENISDLNKTDRSWGSCLISNHHSASFSIIQHHSASFSILQHHSKKEKERQQRERQQRERRLRDDRETTERRQRDNREMTERRQRDDREMTERQQRDDREMTLLKFCVKFNGELCDAVSI